MALIAFKRSGTRPNKLQSSAAKRLALTLSLLLSATLLGACQTTSSTEIRAQCSAWRAITYSSKGDTALTIKQVRIHNRTGQNLGCWK